MNAAINTDPQTHAAIPYLLEALRAIPQHEKLEYRQALRVAPHLVEEESDPIAFLRYCDWNATAAARRLVVYWRKRVEIFGEVRAFLPIVGDFSGNGALGKEEIEVLRSGVYCMMPNDSHGRAVAHSDGSRIPPQYQGRVDVRLRACFCMGVYLSLNVNSQMAGAQILMRGQRSLADGNIEVAHKVAELLHEVIPLRVQNFHLVYLKETGNGFVSSVVPLLITWYGRFYRNNSVIHSCETVEMVVKSLARHGVPRECLPRSMGGFIDPDGTVLPLDVLSNIGRAMGTHLVGGGEYNQRSKDLNITATPDVVDPQIPGRDVDYGGSRGGVWQQQHVDSLNNMAMSLGPLPMQSPLQADDNKNKSDGLFDRLDMLVTEADNGSPFEPRPICSQVQQQHHHDACGAADDTLHDAAPMNAMLQTRVAGLQEAPRQTPKLYAPMQQEQDCAPNIIVDTGTAGVPPFLEAPDMRDRSLSALDEAMRNLRGDERSAYEEALRKAPSVVKMESNPLVYLRFDEFNIWAAAKRLALYWKYRVQYFGDRAFLPLTQTGGGALWEKDRPTLASGSFSILPADSRGRPVLCCDPSKCPDSATEASRIRVALYFFSILCCEYPASMAEGCVVLVFAPTRIAALSKVDGVFRKTMDIVVNSFPIQHYETHVIYSPSPTSSPIPSFTGSVLPVLAWAFGRLLTQEDHDEARFYVGDTRDELQRKLALCGLSVSALQAALSGGVSDHDFAQWLTHRQKLESERYGGDRQHQQHYGTAPQNAPSPSEESTEASSQGGSHENSSVTPQLQHLRPAAAPSGSAGPSERYETLQEPTAGTSPYDGSSREINSAMELLPTSEKKDYLEAMKNVPHLVMKESHPTRFLRFENNNALAAARRLAAYWRIRCDVFQECAFLPMNQTGDGALGRKDLAILQSGFLTQLPNDNVGCSVICCDGRLLEKSSSSQPPQLRVFFYLWSVVSENCLSQTDGCSVIYSIEPSLDDSAFRNCLEFAMEAHPVRLKRLHLLCCRPDCTSQNEFLNFNKTVKETVKMFDRAGGQEKNTVHVCESWSGFAAKLGSHEMPKQVVPKSFGGSWRLEDFALWQELRIRHEWDLNIPPPSRYAAESYSIPTSSADLPPPSRLNANEKAERNRRMNVLYSRRKRDRKRFEVLGLQEKVTILGEEKQKLVREGHELEGLLEQARSMVDDQ